MNNMETIIENLTLDQERALYNLHDAEVRNCVFAGPADGESALKEARNIKVSDCDFQLRYPLWHVHGFEADRIRMNETCRAAIWYCSDGAIRNSDLGGIKVLRECRRMTLDNCRIKSDEFAWMCEDIAVKDCEISSVYAFLCGKRLRIEGTSMPAKYSFQYAEDVEISNCEFDTKDALWHSKGATVRDSVFKGEYLAWYSEGLTLINCRIISTQPLCYCKDLKLINCTMEGCDLAFEYSDVDAELTGHIDSIKNPRSGRIVADSIGEIVREGAVIPCNAEIIVC